MHSHSDLTNSPDLEAKAERGVCVPALASAKPEENRQTHTLLSPVSKSVPQGFGANEGVGCLRVAPSLAEIPNWVKNTRSRWMSGMKEGKALVTP